jgi:acetyl-CoA carboxylase carboxyltransferase component
MSAEAVAFVSGPQMVAEFTGVEVGLHELGGVATHARSSGLCAVEADDVEGALAGCWSTCPRTPTSSLLPPRPPIPCCAPPPSCAT